MNQLEMRRLSIGPPCRTHRDAQDSHDTDNCRYAQTDHLKPTKPGCHWDLPPLGAEANRLFGLFSWFSWFGSKNERNQI